MTQRSWPWRGPESDDENPDETREAMSPHPADETRAYDRAMRTTPTEREWQGGRHPAPGLADSIAVAVATEGEPGKARGSALTTRVSGALLCVHLNYGDGAPTTTDVRVSRVAANGDRQDILLVPESSTDGYHAPNSAPAWRPVATSFSFVPFVLEDEALEVRVTDCDAASAAVTATIFLHAI